jgi:hypothetical protein
MMGEYDEYSAVIPYVYPFVLGNGLPLAVIRPGELLGGGNLEFDYLEIEISADKNITVSADGVIQIVGGALPAATDGEVVINPSVRRNEFTQKLQLTQDFPILGTSDGLYRKIKNPVNKTSDAIYVKCAIVDEPTQVNVILSIGTRKYPRSQVSQPVTETSKGG